VSIEYPISGFTVYGYSDPQGSSFEHLLPPGAYVAYPDQFEYGGVGYAVSQSERIAFTVEPKSDREVVLFVDTSKQHVKLPHDFVVPENRED
jgi:hypothetical protein